MAAVNAYDSQLVAGHYLSNKAEVGQLTKKMIHAALGSQIRVPAVAEALLHTYGEELVGGCRARPDIEAYAWIYFAQQNVL